MGKDRFHLGRQPLFSGTPSPERPKGRLPLQSSGVWRWTSALLLLVGCLWMMPHGDFAETGVVPAFWFGLGLMGLGFVIAWSFRSLDALWFWAIALLTRLILLPMAPGDDIWRYLWEGYVQTLGFNPFQVPPDAAALIPYRFEWWPLINNPTVSALYPPLTQLGFRGLAAIAPSVLLFKLAFVAADLGICGLLSHRFGHRHALLYAWNPLVLYSFAGAAHYDSWFLLPLVAAWLLCDRPSSETPWAKVWSALFIGISVAIKWMSLPMLAFLIWRSLLQKQILQAGLIIGLGALPLVLSALPFCQPDACSLIPTDSVFVSHGRSAELIPRWVGQLWKPSRQENWLFLVPLALTCSWLLWRSRTFLDFAEWYLFSVLILSPIIHAWYFTWLIPFSVASRNRGTQMIGLSAFVYFVLPHRLALGREHWSLSDRERFLLWMPLLIGWLLTVTQTQRRLPDSRP